MEKEKKSLTVNEIKSYDIAKPEQISKMANVVKAYVVKNNLYVRIVDKNYVLVEGWQFAGGLMGLFPKVVKVEDLGNNKWLAQVDIVSQRDGSVASSGFAICSKEENKKKSFDEYAILSMAQTRAIGKAYRNLIGWVMKLAGYEATPAEEIKITANQKLENEINSSKQEQTAGKKVEELKKLLTGKTDEEKLKFLKDKIGINLKSFEITEKHAIMVIASFLNNQVK